MDELIYLEPDEEITAIVDRLRSIEADSVRLIVPKGALVLQSLVSLKLLKREADHLGKMIALVTQDAVGFNLGEQAGISVFAKPKDREPVFAAPTAVTRPSRRQTTNLPPRATVDDATLAEPEESEPAPGAPYEAAPNGLHVHYYDGDPPAPLAPPNQARTQTVPASAETLIRRVAGRKRGAGGLGKIFRWLFILAFLGALGYLAFLEFAPRATIDVTLATEPLDQTVTVTADTSVTDPQLDNATIPGALVSTDIMTEKSVPATGKKDIGAKATATLNLFNYWDANPQSFPVGTVVRASDGTNFVMTGAATIPGATTTLKEGKVVTTPGQTSTTIEAQDPGPAANGKSGTFTIPSLPQVRQDKIYGQTTDPTAGGTAKEVTVVSQTDLDALKNTTHDAALADGKTAIAKQTAAARLLDGASKLTITNEELSAELGAQADMISDKLSGKLQGITFTDSQLNAAATAVLKQAIPSGRTLVLRASDTLLPTVKNFDFEKGQLTLEAKFSTRTALEFDQTNFVGNLTGKSVADAMIAGKAVSGVADVTITNRPRWFRTMPKRTKQIIVNIHYQ